MCGGCTSCDSCTGCASCTTCVGCTGCTTGCTTACTGCNTCDGGCTGCTTCVSCDGYQTETSPRKEYEYGCASVQTGGFDSDVNNSCTGGGNSTEYDPDVNPAPPEIPADKWQKMSTEERLAALKELGYDVTVKDRDPNCPPAPDLDNIGLGKDEKTGEEPNIKTGLVETTSDGKTHVPYYDADTGEYLGEMVYDPATDTWSGSVKNPATGKTTEIKDAKDDGKGNFTSGTKETINPDGSKNTNPANPTDTSTPPTYTPPPSSSNPNPTPQPSAPGCS